MEELERNIRLVERSIQTLERQAGITEKEIFQALIKKLRDFPTKGGKFQWDESNKKLLAKIQPEIAQILAASDFDNDMLLFFDDFDQIGQNLADVHKRVNDIRISGRELQAEKTIIVEETLKGLAKARIDQTFMVPVRQALYNKIRFGASVTETEAYLRQIVEGGDGSKGFLQRWIGQVARDSANQYEGTINQTVKEKHNLTAYEYVGPIVTHSRPQCRRWVKMERIEDSELEKEIEWAFKNGAGMVPGTDPSTFAVYRGGYNCNHTAFPVK